MEKRKMGEADPKAYGRASFSPMLRKARRLVIMIVGATVLFLGLAMIVLPGPAFVVIPASLAILGTEFAWARRWLRLIQDSAQKGVGRVKAYSTFSGVAADDGSSQGASSPAGPCNEPLQRNPAA
jgi:tellurite resistance protein TerC